MRTAVLFSLCVAVGVHGFSREGLAQAYPSKPVRIVVGITPGSPSDSIARLLAQGLGAAWGQPVVVENRPGAGGNIGADTVAKSEPDGHSMLLTASGPIVVNISLMEKLPFDPLKDFAPVTMVYTTPMILTAPPALPVSSVAELIDYARARPGKLNYSSTGAGTPLHLAAELLKQRAGLDVLHVPYKGGPESTAAVMNGEVAFNFNGLFVMPFVQAGKLKALGVASQQRTRLAPDLPTIAESGVPGFDVNAWGGLFLQGRTPQGIVARVQGDVVRLLGDPGLRAKMMGVGVEPIGNSTEEFTRQIRAEIPRWAQVIKAAGIRPQ
jgi:tripartite-type tricarboxylate transporter receptor subunit TctC